LFASDLTRRRTVAALSLLLAGLAWLVLTLSPPGWLRRAQELSLDLAWRLVSTAGDERRIVLIDIDEKSLQQIGAWPWPRDVQARLIGELAAQGVALQVFDIVFNTPQPRDTQLAAAIDTHRPVLAQAFATPEQGGDTVSGALAGALDWPGCPPPFSQASGFLANQSDLLGDRVATQAQAVGHITPALSIDGVIRHQSAVICYQNRAYPALAIAAAAQGADLRAWALQRGVRASDPHWWLQPEPGAIAPIPLSAGGLFRIPWWIRPESFISVSASDLLQKRVPAGLLSRAWVIVGSSAFGLGDTVATPFSGAAAGMQVHAQLLAGLIDGRLPYTPSAAPWLEASGVAAGLLVLLVLGTWSVRPGRRLTFPVQFLPLLGLAWAGLLWAAHLGLLVSQAWVIDWMPAALVVIFASLAWSILEHTRSRSERLRLYSHLSSYLPAPVAASLALQPPSSAVRANTRVITALFADIRNFSAYCENRPPEEAAAVLHAFFSVATRVIEQHGGVIEAFQGDAVLAVWYADSPGQPGTAQRPNHAMRALNAAVELQQATAGCLPDPAPEGLEPLALGVGIESGPATEGSFGLSRRRAHLVMGRTVTIASRLVGMTADLAHPILVGEGVAAHVAVDGLESMGTFLLDGLRVPHHVYGYRQRGSG
jgi:adenylate cyclase